MNLKSKYVAIAAFVSCTFSGNCMAGLAEGVAAYDRFEYVKAYREWLPLAKKGNATAQLYLATLYEYGNGVIQDNDRSLMWLRLSAKQGNPGAQYALGLKYASGNGIPKDPEEADKLINLAARNGNTYAILKIAEMSSTTIPKKMASVSADDACTACHLIGKEGAPKIGDKAMWSTRLAKGPDSLYKNVLEGSSTIRKNCGVAGISETKVRASIDAMLQAIN